MSDGDRSLFDKIGDALGGEHHEPAPEPLAPPPEPPKQQHSGSFLERIGDKLSGEAEQPPPPAAPPTPPKEQSLFEKIGERLSGHDEPEPAAAPPPPPPEKHEGLLGRISSALGQEEEQPVAPPPPRQEGLLDKISGVFGKEEAPPPPPPKEENLLDKMKAAIEQGHKEQEKPKTFGEKVNEAFGGGKKAEKDEDGLDKAVDFVQEHVFKKGDQRNESAWEQAKDEQISDALRKTYKNATGHEFFVKDKE
ncbi:hypothetical protein BD626DRAFT_571113 [Schizophyllum amplum]|uniref:Uncharacterized protein n=1 Tax=Schizophyllum amplum TaxID=97359 RepID=A0A550C8F0_9AGAR|nr:hypothetical protein BD626DRAFT_571113 [Auriculariopsis ampla]